MVSATSLPRPLLVLLAAAAGASVANVYYAQPLLDQLARALRWTGPWPAQCWLPPRPAACWRCLARVHRPAAGARGVRYGGGGLWLAEGLPAVSGGDGSVGGAAVAAPARSTGAVGPSTLARAAGLDAGHAAPRSNAARARAAGIAAVAGLNVFWAAAPLPLSAPPLHWSTAAIGALGLAGVVGALMAARVGHWMDRGSRIGSASARCC